MFARQELTRLALAILREADGPLPIAVIAVRACLAKGIAWSDPKQPRWARTRLRETFGELRARGVLEAVGSRNATRHRLRSHQSLTFISSGHYAAYSWVFLWVPVSDMAARVIASLDRRRSANMIVSNRDGSDKRRIAAVLQLGLIKAPIDAVRVAIVTQYGETRQSQTNQRSNASMRRQRL